MHTPPFRHSVSVDRVDAGFPFLNIHVEGPLDVPRALIVATDVTAKLKPMLGHPFGLLIDVRQVTECDAEAASVMQGIEMNAAGLGLEKVAHLVAQSALAEQAQAEVKEVGAARLIGTFDDEEAARQFASGLKGEPR